MALLYVGSRPHTARNAFPQTFGRSVEIVAQYLSVARAQVAGSLVLRGVAASTGAADGQAAVAGSTRGQVRG